MANELPYLPFFVGDFLVTVSTWPPDRVGAYGLALFYQWEHGGLPADDEKELAGILHTSRPVAVRLWQQIHAKFRRLDDGLWWNARLELVREQARTQVMAKHNRAKSGALGRWGKGALVDHGGPIARKVRLENARKLGTHTDAEWHTMLVAYNHVCLKCGNSNGKLVKDHIVPLYQGGSDSILNIQPLCLRCNASKGPDATDYRIGQSGTRQEWLPAQAVLKQCSTPAIQNQIQGTTPPLPPSAEGGSRRRRRRSAPADPWAENTRKTQEMKQLMASGLSREDAARKAGFR